MTLERQFKSLKKYGYVVDADNLPPRQWADGKMHEKKGGEWFVVAGEQKKDQRGAGLEQVSSLSNINAKELETPTRSYLLPPMNKRFTEAIGKKCKGLILSKHTIERMAKGHPEMKDGENRKRILNNALNNFTQILHDRPEKKPNYYVAVKEGNHYDISVIDTEKKDNYFEIVDWREIDSEGYERMVKNMEQEGGQFLITDGRTSTGQPTFLLFCSNESTLTHDGVEVKSLSAIFRQLKGA